VNPVDVAADLLNAAEGAEPAAREVAFAALAGNPNVEALLQMRAELAAGYRAAGAPEPVTLASGRVWDEASERARMEARQVLRERRAAEGAPIRCGFCAFSPAPCHECLSGPGMTLEERASAWAKDFVRRNLASAAPVPVAERAEEVA
jgi:hypothetical protein